MRQATIHAMYVFLLPLAACAAACTGSPQSATAPSSIGGNSVSAAAASERHGAPSNGSPANGSPSTNNGHSVEIQGTVQISTGACPSLRLTVAGKIVTTSASTQFDDGPCTAVHVASRVEVKGTSNADGSIAASRVQVRKAEDDNEPNEPDDQHEVTGPIVNTAGICPALTFTVGTTSIRTNAATVFHDVSCEALASSVVVEVKGNAQADGSLLATQVERPGER